MSRSSTTVFLLLSLLFAPTVGASTIDDILSYRSLGDVHTSPMGSAIVFVVTSANFESNVLDSNIWYLGGTDNLALQLTKSPKRDWQPRWSPDGKVVAFLSDRDGTTNIWVMSPLGGEAERVTDVEGGLSSFEWLPDGTGFVFIMTDPEPEAEKQRKEDQNDPILVDQNFKYARLYKQNLDGDETRCLTQQDVHINSFDIAPKGEARIVFSHQPTPKVPDGRLRSDLSILDLETGAIRELVSQPGLDLDPSFSPDGEWIAFVSMGGKADWIANYFVYVVRPDGSELRNASEVFDERVRGKPSWSRDGDRVYFLGYERADNRVWQLDIASGQVQPAMGFDNGKSISSFSLDGKGGLHVAASTPNAPAEVFRVPMGSDAAKQLTKLNEDYPTDAIGTTELVVYESHDGLAMEGFLVKPVGFRVGERYPLLVIVHGGPSGVFSSAFTPRRGAYPVHAFAEQGYLVFMPNPRGSGGFGYEMRRSNFKDWGFGDYKDIMAGVDHLIEEGLADADRMGVMGWSYGGFMTSWIVTQTSRFKAASVGAAVTNPYSFYGLTDIPDFTAAYFGGRPWEKTTDYLRHAAVHHAGNATTPTLIQHGAEDVRVPLAQGKAFYRALKKNDVHVEMVIYPRTPHGLREPKLIRHALEGNLEWFDKWVRSAESTTN